MSDGNSYFWPGGKVLWSFNSCNIQFHGASPRSRWPRVRREFIPPRFSESVRAALLLRRQQPEHNGGRSLSCQHVIQVCRVVTCSVPRSCSPLCCLAFRCQITEKGWKCPLADGGSPATRVPVFLFVLNPQMSNYPVGTLLSVSSDHAGSFVWVLPQIPLDCLTGNCISMPRSMFNNLTCQVESFSNLLDLSNVSVWERANEVKGSRMEDPPVYPI